MSEDYLAQQQPTLKWNPARSVWETIGTESLLCEHLEPFLQTWPTSGLMQNGQVFELPMQEHRTTDSESSSSLIPESSKLRTPSVTDSTGGAISERQARARNRMVKVADQAAQLAFGNGHKVSSSISESLMPTPNTMDHLPARTPEQKAKNKGKGGYANVRETVVNDLLPTPVATEGTKAPAQQDAETKSKTGQVWLSNVAKGVSNDNLPTPTASDWKGANHSGSGSASSRSMATVVEQTNWGKFEPAIRRWEQVIQRQAPAPTKPDGKDGNHRLSSRFTEWMMGLPDGWITDVGLTRNEELKACGNGVVPQQAELALRVLLDGIQIERGVGQVNLPTPTVSDTFTGNLKSTQQKPGSMHSVTLPQAVRMVEVELKEDRPR